jgi:hypothetical protein
MDVEVICSDEEFNTRQQSVKRPIHKPVPSIHCWLRCNKG